MYARTLNDQVLTFGVSGKLIMNVLVMFDNETDSYWSQLLGEAIDGPLLGEKLTPIAAVQTTWGEWKKQYPETLALETNGRGRYDTYASYYSGNSAGVLGEARSDTRIPSKELVAGVVIDGQPVVYPHGILAQELVVNDVVNETPLTVLFDLRTATAVVYEREVAGQILTFELTDDPLTFVDQETGTSWSLLTGKAISGALDGEALIQIPSTASFWFGWKDWYPDTLVYGVEPVSSSQSLVNSSSPMRD